MEDMTVFKSDRNGNAFIGVLDGHGGDMAAILSQEYLSMILKPERSYSSEWDELLSDLDTHLKSRGCYSCGTTLNLLHFNLNDGYAECVNVGDSRAMVIHVDKDDVSLFSTSHIVMSEDHKPYNEDEYNRITEAGGHVAYGRVNGMLALSRALGDFMYKQKKDIVSSEPDVSRVLISDMCASVYITATDGFWDVMSSNHTSSVLIDLLSVMNNREMMMEFMREKEPKRRWFNTDPRAWDTRMLAGFSVNNGIRLNCGDVPILTFMNTQYGSLPNTDAVGDRDTLLNDFNTFFDEFCADQKNGMDRYDLLYVRNTYIDVLNAIMEQAELMRLALTGGEMTKEQKIKWLLTALITYVSTEKDTTSNDNITINVAIIDPRHILL